MDNSSAIRGFVVIVSAIALALWLGVSIVTNQSETLLYSAGGGMLLICAFLGRKIWLLLVFFSALSFPLMRGFGTSEVGQALFIGFSLVMFLMRRLPMKIKFGELECWMLLIAACVLQIYLRNPVGLNIFSAGSVGARPYFIVTLAFVTGTVLGNIIVPPGEIKWAMRLSIIGTFLGMFLTTVRMRGGGGEIAMDRRSKLEDAGSSGRIGFLGSLSYSISRIIASYISPLKALLHPFWMPVILATVAAAAGSGYRNNVAAVGLIYLIAIAYRGGFAAVFLSCITGAMGIGLLALVNLAVPLPPNVQRALSPFPGTWEARYVEAAEGSTDWRIEMWKEALFTDYWIHNKIFGDGLGFTRQEYELMQSLEDGGRGLETSGSGMSAQQEAMMITGGYHSGPVQCVRIIGYAGLAVTLMAMIRFAVHAHRLILRCRGTEWYPLALYTGIPVISLPFMYTFVFGDFTRDVSAIFFAYGMLSLLRKNLPLPAYVKPRREPYILQRQKPTQARAHRIPG
ncbi:MAG: hypothetical protein ABI600_04365 [Luteolibacter sp.]